MHYVLNFCFRFKTHGAPGDIMFTTRPHPGHHVYYDTVGSKELVDYIT